VKKKLFIC